MLVTSKQLIFISPVIPESKANIIADALNKVLPSYKMDDADILEEFIPNLLVESGSFSTFSENLNYQSIALQKLFSRARISMADTINLGRNTQHGANQQAIANTIYGGVWGKKNLGNIFPNDGWDFRGFGLIQGTGRGIAEDFTAFYNKKFKTSFSTLFLVKQMRTIEGLVLGLHFACWFFSIAKNLIPLALTDHFKEICQRINGGFNGFDERSRFYNRAKTAFSLK